MKRFLIISAGLLLPTFIFAHTFWEQHAKGWYWYQPSPVEKSRSSSLKEPSGEKGDATQAMEKLQQDIKQALNQAIVFPTEANVAHYIELQNKIAHQAHVFSDTWQRLLLSYPGLDYSLVHPTNQMSRHVYFDEERIKRDNIIRALSKTYGLFFFYKGSCSYCHQFAPLIKAWANHYGFSIVAISLDGGLLPEFQDARLNTLSNQAIALKLNVHQVPALLAVNPAMNRVIPIAYGLVSEEELSQRIYFLSQTLSQERK